MANFYVEFYLADDVLKIWDLDEGAKVVDSVTRELPLEDVFEYKLWAYFFYWEAVSTVELFDFWRGLKDEGLG